MWVTTAQTKNHRDAGRARRIAKKQTHLTFEKLESRLVLSNAIPQTNLTLTPEALIGTNLDFSVGFANSSPSQSGFGPFIDLILPATGANGNNGITFSSASYLGSSVTSTVITFDGAGHATHPYAKDSASHAIVVNGTPGDQLVVLALPFGSVTPGQPTANIDIVASLSNLAALGTPLNIKVDGGFRYGNDALDNPATDPSLIGSTTSSTVTPTLLLVKTTYLGPESETATGPNFPEQYLITATVAPGQTIKNLDLTDLLPSSLQFVSIDSATANGSTSQHTITTPSKTAPGGSLTEEFDQVVGTGGQNDVSLKFTIYVPRDKGTNTDVLNLGSGSPVQAIDQASATGTWHPLNPAFTDTIVTSNTATHTLNQRSVAVQKSVSDITNPGSPRPGDVLAYTITFQISDFFAFQNLLASDVFSDGQHFDSSFTPTLRFAQHGTNLPAAAIDAANFFVGLQDTTAGTTPITFDVSGELTGRGITNGILLGGSVPNVGTGGPKPSPIPGFSGTTGTITFHTIIQQRFDYNFPSGEAFVDQGDTLTNHLSLSGKLLDYSNLSVAGPTPSDTSSATVSIPRTSLVESIYAINGVAPSSNLPKITAGDTVTYRLQFDLSTSNIENLLLDSFLPLPVFDSTEILSFDNAQSSTAPLAGHIQFGPADTYHSISGIVPSLTSNNTANSFSLDYGTYHDPSQRASKIDLLYTVTASNKPFADGLFLTTQAHESEGSTNNGSAIANAIVQVQLTEPSLEVSKGAVAIDNPNATLSSTPLVFTAPGTAGTRFNGTISSTTLTSNPLTATVAKADAGDTVTFAIVVQNLGTGVHGAYDLTIKDLLPSGFAIPSSGINLNVTDGTGTALSTVNIGSGTGLLDQGIRIIDPQSSGALSAYDTNNGKNVLVITYDLQIASSAAANQTYTNTASLTNYSASPGGPDFLSTPLTAVTTTTIAGASLAKALVATNQPFTTGNKLAIGEIGTYTVTITVPEGTTPLAKLIDTLPSGLGIVSIDSITPSSEALTTSQGTWSSILSSHTTVGTRGSSATFDFGTITNTDRDNSVAETITVQYRLAALNAAINSNNAVANNSAALTYTGGSATASASATIAVPLLKLTATVDKTTAQAGDTVTYTLTLSNLTSFGSGTTAFDINISDILPTGINYITGSLTNTAGQAPTTLDDSSGAPVIEYASMAIGVTSTITFSGTLDTSTGPYQILTDTAKVIYTTLPGTVTTAQSPYVTTSTERTGLFSDPGSTANNLSSTKTVSVSTTPPAVTKTVQGTNQASTSGTNVAIGELVQYQVVVTVPNGTAASSTLTDTLPAGLALVSLDSISTSEPLSTSLSGGFDTSLTAATIGVNGSSFSLDLGTVTNSNLDSAVAQTLTLNFTAVVLNAATNQSGTSLQNSVTFAAQGGSTNAKAPTLNVVTPVLKLTDTTDKSSVQAGEIVTYTITIANLAANGSTENAFDVLLSDLVPSGIIYVASSLTNTAGIVPTSLDDSSGTPVVRFSSLPLGSTSTIMFRAIVQSSVGPFQTLTDNASAFYSTLPGDLTTAQSTYSSLSTERTGHTTDPGTTANNLVTASSASIATVAPQLVKTIVGTSLTTTNGTNVAIGETVQYQLIATIPNGTSRTTTIADLLPAGLALVSFDSILASSSLNTSASEGFNGVLTSAIIGNGGQSFLLDFGTLQNSDLDASSYETITIRYTTVVLNTAGNIAGTSLQNAATLIVFGGSKQASAPSLSVVEPKLNLSITPSTTFADADGSPVTFTVVVSAKSGTSANAFDVSLSDLIPSGFQYIPNSFMNTSGVIPSTISDTSGALSATFDSLVPGSSSTLIFLAKLTSDTTPGTAVSDSVSVTYTSLPGAVTSPQSPYRSVSTERTGSPLDPGDTANTYATTANTSVTPYSNSINGIVYLDTNNNGIREQNDSLLVAASLSLSGVDNLGTSIVLTTNTDNSGSFSFPNLRPGIYTVTIADYPGDRHGKATAGTPFGGDSSKSASISGITINPGSNATGIQYNFGEIPPSAISGRVFFDPNNNSIVDISESGLVDVGISLTGTDIFGAEVSLSTSTNNAGIFNFGNLLPGNYTVTQTQPTGYLQGHNSLGNSGGTFTGDVLSSISISPGVSASGILFGELLPASIAGNVYVDINDNGLIESSETLVSNVSVHLSGTDDLGATVDLMTVTSKGVYQFINLRPGLYSVSEVTPLGYIDGKATAGSLGGIATDRDVVSSITVASNDVGIGYNLAILPPSSISGVAYLDKNSDGLLGVNETKLAGISVTLTGTDDLGKTVALTTLTDSMGSYSFIDLEPGEYTVSAEVPIGDLAGKATAGSLGGNATTLDQISAIKVDPGVNGTGNDLAFVQPTQISGLVYLDKNNDGIVQSNETGLESIAVSLTGKDDLGQSVSLTTLTAFDGTYSFPGLRPGDYALHEALPNELFVGKITVGNRGGTAIVQGIEGISLSSGDQGSTYNFAAIAPSIISGLVYEDINDDRIVQSSDPRLTQITLTLTGQNDLGEILNLSTQIDSQGTFQFGNLRPGTYDVTETPPAQGYLEGKSSIGSAGGSISTYQFHQISISPGTTADDYDFAHVRPSSLAGFVFDDLDDNGSKSESESFIASAGITLTGTDDLGNQVSLTMNTDQSGSFSFPNLRPGSYVITCSHVNGYLSGITTAGSQGGTANETSISSITLNSATDGIQNRFALVKPASLTGFVYLDDLNAGQPSESSPRLADVTVTLTGTDDRNQPIHQQLLTLQNGSYQFTGLRPGQYFLTKTPNSAYGDGAIRTGSAGGVVGQNTIKTINLMPGQSDDGSAFGELAGSVHGTVFVDLNRDGLYQNNDPIVPGAKVTLMDSSMHPVATTTSDANGSYIFRGLPAGNYTVIADAQTPNGPRTIQNKPVSLPAGASVPAIFPLSIANVIINGTVFSDISDDGHRSKNESGVGGVLVTLSGVDDGGNQVTQTSRTNPDGTYQFTGLRLGNYAVTDTRPSGYLVGRNGDTVSGINATNGQPIQVAAIPILPEAKVTGVVYLDANNDGRHQTNEYGIAHVFVTLKGTDDLGHLISRVIETDANGVYQFGGLRPGSYSVTRDALSQFLPGATTVGTLGGHNLKSAIVSIPLESTQVGVHYDFGAKIRPDCKLAKGPLHAVVVAGKHPSGPLGKLPKFGQSELPLVRYWLPKLAERLGLSPTNDPTYRLLNRSGSKER